MQKIALFALVSCSLLSGCARRINDPCEVVMDQSYIHRYGVPVAPEDWSSQGETGKVVTTLKSGVVVTKSYANGVLEGETSYTYPHSSLIEKKEYYSQGQLTKETSFYRSGGTSEQVVYESPQVKVVHSWYENGAPRSQETYQNEFLVKGEYFNIFHQPDSKIVSKEGLRTRRDSFGHILGVDSVQEGIVVQTKTFHPSGAIKQEIPYQDGQVSGELKTFLPDGEPSLIETWVRGEKTGATIQFENGEKIAVIPFVRGVKDGIEKRYRDGNVLVEEISWVQDVRHGPTVTTIGETASVDYYYQGKPVSKAVFEKMTNGITPHSPVR